MSFSETLQIPYPSIKISKKEGACSVCFELSVPVVAVYEFVWRPFEIVFNAVEMTATSHVAIRGALDKCFKMQKDIGFEYKVQTGFV